MYNKVHRRHFGTAYLCSAPNPRMRDSTDRSPTINSAEVAFSSSCPTQDAIWSMVKKVGKIIFKENGKILLKKGMVKSDPKRSMAKSALKRRMVKFATKRRMVMSSPKEGWRSPTRTLNFTKNFEGWAMFIT